MAENSITVNLISFLHIYIVFSFVFKRFFMFIYIYSFIIIHFFLFHSFFSSLLFYVFSIHFFFFLLIFDLKTFSFFFCSLSFPLVFGSKLWSFYTSFSYFFVSLIQKSVFSFFSFALFFSHPFSSKVYSFFLSPNFNSFSLLLFQNLFSCFLTYFIICLSFKKALSLSLSPSIAFQNPLVSILILCFSFLLFILSYNTCFFFLPQLPSTKATIFPPHRKTLFTAAVTPSSQQASAPASFLSIQYLY
ncbi:unnamed protein product [Acanthosepion pharaonis]|uniref:Uncharacterized protein n=1 Tax=Acanthosepion pharaonis TaxID=158019 RepID=A0A812ELH1_ACAPH|nr:unnamed protein product [Sepia pharaonis]